MTLSSNSIFQYKGYRIPSNAVLLINVWRIFHDETLFEEPDIFRPQRFIESPTGIKKGLESKAHPLLNDIVFGAGRRVCPAMHLARNSLVTFSSLSWRASILKLPRVAAEHRPFTMGI